MVPTAVEKWIEKNPDHRMVMARKRWEANGYDFDERLARTQEWVKDFVAVHKNWSDSGSYSLKHMAEEYYDEYIHNDSLIDAMVMAGYEYKSIGAPNYVFKAKFRTAGIRHDSARTEWYKKWKPRQWSTGYVK